MGLSWIRIKLVAAASAVEAEEEIDQADPLDYLAQHQESGSSRGEINLRWLISPTNSSKHFMIEPRETR